MKRTHPNSTRTDTLFPYTTLFRSIPVNDEGMIEHYVLDAGLGDADDDDFDEAVEAVDAQLPENRYLDRELSWLAFNRRVLELEEDESLPTLERANFLAIFASKLDEFYMVRVAGLQRRTVSGIAMPTNVGLQPLDVSAANTGELGRCACGDRVI